MRVVGRGRESDVPARFANADAFADQALDATVGRVAAEERHTMVVGTGGGQLGCN